MKIKSYKPLTPSLRHRIILSKKDISKEDPIKKLLLKINKTGGRNNRGRITVHHKGGGHKRRYRVINFKRNLLEPATVLRIEYDPNRSANIALIMYESGYLSYILAPDNLQIGQKLETGFNVKLQIGNTLPLRFLPKGTIIHNIELKPGAGGQIARAAGTYAKLLSKHSFGYAVIRLKSGKLRLIHLDCLATIGQVSNKDKIFTKLGKAGASRWLGIRPTVRGVAMNPIDHPHGGGEGKTSGGRHPVTPWGILTKGKKTRKNKKTNKYILN